MKDIVTLRAKMYSYLTDDGCVEKRANDVKKCVIKRRIKLQDYKGCLKNNKTMLIFQQRFRCKVYTEKFNKVALNANRPWEIVQRKTDETSKNEIINIIINFDEVTGENTQERNPRWPQIPDYRYRILIAADSG